MIETLPISTALASLPVATTPLPETVDAASGVQLGTVSQVLFEGGTQFPFLVANDGAKALFGGRTMINWSPP